MSEHDNDDKAGDTIVPIDPESTIPRPPRPRVVRPFENEATVPIVDKPIRLESRWRRMGPMLLVLMVVLALGPFISRFIDSYRAVVLDTREGEMFIVAETVKLPRWVDGNVAEPGQVIIKESFTWNPTVTEAVPKDGPLLDLHRRWMGEYEGKIVEMRPPHAPGHATVAVVETSGGERIEVALWAEHLATAGVGRYLKKEPRAWDPYLVAGPAASGSGRGATFELAPPAKQPPAQPQPR